MDFLWLHFGGVPVELPQKISKEKLHLQLNNFTQKLDFDVCGLGEEERTKFRKKKRKKQ